MASVKITEIFYSLQGETSTVGLPTVFVRLTGCPLRCQYCDTAYAFKGGTRMSIEDVLEKVASFKAKYITVTGGEPLAQPACFELLTALCDLEYQVSLETSGALDISRVDKRVNKILDIKTPASKESHRNLYQNFDYLNSTDEIKFVICDKQDYLWAQNIIKQYQLENKNILFSPSFEELNPTDLADWIVEDKLAVRMQLQLHKILWNDEPGR